MSPPRASRRPFADITNSANDIGIITPDSSPIKKAKIQNDVSSTRKSNMSNYAVRRLANELGGHFAYEARKYDFVDSIDRPKHFMSKNTQFCDFSFVVEEPILYSINCNSNKGIVFVGTEGGNLVSIKIKEGTPLYKCVSAKEKMFDSAITDIDTHGDMVACASREKYLIKRTTDTDATYGDIGIGSIKQIRFDRENPNIILTSSRSGEIALRDLRSKDVYSFNGAHDIRSKTKLGNRKNVSVTAMEWVSSNTIVTGGEANIGLKLWDLRKIYKGTTRSGELDSTPITELSGRGVTSIAIDSMTQKIWAMSLDSKVRSYSVGGLSLGPQNVLSSPFLNVRSFYTKLNILEYHDGSILTCGGSGDGPIMFALPNSSYAPAPGPSIMPRHGHSSPITCIATDSFSENIFTASDDGIVRRWSREPAAYYRLINRTNKSELSEWCWAEDY